MKLILRSIFVGALVFWIIAIQSCYEKKGDTGKAQSDLALENNSPTEKEIVIKWFGQSCFLITTSEETQILTDPVEFKGYHLPNGIDADIVTVSHHHPDHNRIDLVCGSPELLEGTTPDIQKVNVFDRTINDVRIFSVPSFHSPGKYGMNAIFVFEFDGIRIAHLGDLGTTLSDRQIEAIGKVDILMIPVGGQFTISGTTADSVLNQIQAQSIIFPMHYKTEAFNSLPYTADDFLKSKERRIKRIPGNEIRLTLSKLPRMREFVVLDYID